MDCCGSGKTEKDDKENKAGQLNNESKPAGKEQSHAGGCCGGGTGMWLHIVIMLIVFIAIWYFTGR